MFTAKAPYKFMKLKMHLRIKQATLRTLYSYVGILSLLVNTSSPFLVSLQYTAYAQEVGVAVEESAPSEEPSDAPSEEPSGETASAEESASTEESTPAEESVTVEAVAETSVTEEVLGTSTEDQATTETTTEPLAETPSSELPTDETQQGDILPDGVSDYRPEVVEEPAVADSAPVTEIITDTSDVVDPLVEQIEGAVVENEKECLADGAKIVNSSSDEWIVDSEKGYAETKEPVKLGVKYIFPEEEGVSVTFSCLPKNIDDRSVLRIQEVKVSDLNLPEEFKTDAEFAYDITTDMVNGEFEYDLTLPKPEGVEADVIYIEKSLEEVTTEKINKGDLLTVDEGAISQKKDKEDLKVEELDHLTIFMVVDGTSIPNNWGEWEDYYDAQGNLVTDHEDGFYSKNDDSNGGTNVTPAEIDIASAVEKSGTNAGIQSSLQYHYDDGNTAGTCSDDFLYLRMRLEGNPEASGGSGAAYTSYHWDFLIDANGNGTSDYVIDVFGGKTNNFSNTAGGQSGSIGLYPNDSGATTYTVANVLWTRPAVDADNAFTQVEGEDYDDAISGNNQYWMEAAVPLNVNAGFQSALCGQSNLDGQLFASTSTSNTDPLQKDWMNPVGFFTHHVVHKSAENTTDPGATTISDPAEPGDIILYTLTVTNDGNRLIPGFTISDDISDILLYANLVNGNSDGDGDTGVLSGSIISWPQQDIDVGQTITESFSVQIKPYNEWGAGDFVMTNVYGDTVNIDLARFGTITIIKDTAPNSARDFSFTTTGTGLTGFSLDDDGDAALSNTKIFSDVTPGSYSVIESAATGYSLTGLNCVDPTTNSSVNLVNRTASINLGAGENITCTFTNTKIVPTIEVTKTANPTSVPETGANVTFTFTVENTSSEEPVTITSLGDSVYGTLAGDADCQLGTVLAAGADCEFSIVRWVEGDFGGSNHTNTFTGKAVDDDSTEATDTDDATVGFTDVLPTIEVTKTANPTSVPETGANVTFTFTVENIGPEDVVLTSLTDDTFGNLDGAGTCSVPQTVAIGGSYSCTYTTWLSSDSLTAHTNVVTAVAEDDDQTTATDTDDETVTFEDVAPSIRITKTANPTSVHETGADVTFTFLVENIGQEDVTLTSLNDTEFGDLNGKGTCVVPQTILVGGSYSCTHTVFLSSDLLLSHYNVVTATAVDDDRTQTTDDDDETVTFENVTPVVDIEKTVDEEALALPGGEFTFTLNITNNSQETVTITSLTDTNALSQQCLDLIGTSLAAGANISCQYTTTHTQVGTYENTAEITVTDDDESTGTDQDSQTVRVVSLTISKFNNSTQPEEIGDEVLFTIIVKAEGASLTDLLVIDLPSKGFDFLTGSWHASSSILERDVEQDIADNGGIYGYASPGYWPVGNISDGEIITLTYLTEIQPGVDEGDYRDIAWAKAYWGDNEVRDEGPTLVALNGFDSPLLVFAQAVNQGDLNYSNDIFVGTHVAVITPNTPPEAEAEVDEKEIEEEVLGTSTIRLPATGSDTTVLVSALAVMLLGVSMITLSRKKKVLLVLPILLFVSALIPGKVFAETAADPFLMVRIEDPESSFNEPFKITFVVMDASGENRNLTAVCSKDGPSSGWEDFQTISDSNFNENGGTNVCNVTDAVLEGTGTYKFKVTVKAEEAEGSAVSEEATTTYDNDGPDKPKYIEVDRKSDCKYEVTLKTADDSQTDYVEVYMSDEKEFTAGPGSRIRTFDMGSNEKKTFTEEVAGEKCAHRQYFAVRAFDSAGNGSDVEAEELTNVNTVTVNKEETVYEASLTSAGASSIGTGTGSEGAEVVPSEEEIGEGSGEEGSVLGEQVQEEGTQKKSFFGKLLSSPWTWIALVIILGGLTINGLRKRNE